MRLHASCVLIDGGAVLLRGASGSGKSDLALRLIDQGGFLVADDQVLLEREGEALMARPPENLAGLLEIRGIGILNFPHRAPASVAGVVDLVSSDDVERMPEVEFVSLLEKTLPLYRIAAREASAPLKVRLAMQHAAGLIMSAR